MLAKEDPAAHSFFLEGVTLLAYDIAWACCTQGIAVGDRTSFDDICAMGRNLYNLLIGQQLHSTQTGRIYPAVAKDSDTKPTNSSNNNNNDKTAGEDIGKVVSWMGRFSHGTAHDFLGSADGSEFVRSFKLLNPTKLADRLKKKLVTDTAPEWEVVDNEAWESGEDNGAVMIEARRAKKTTGGGEIRNEAETGAGIGGGGRRLSSGTAGTSGWTKLKSR